MASAEALRLGITLRGAQAAGYDEPRDALARAWYPFLDAALPAARWMLLPNLGAEAAVRAFGAWELNALLLTGGDDLGRDPQRDETERALLAHARRRGFPVLGVCRGLQLLWTEAGGRLSALEGHVGHPHRIHGRLGSRSVTSFHGLGLAPEPWPQGAALLARAEDGSPEAIRFPGSPCAGVLWHPEREPQPQPADLDLFRDILLGGPS